MFFWLGFNKVCATPRLVSFRGLPFKIFGYKLNLGGPKPSYERSIPKDTDLGDDTQFVPFRAGTVLKLDLLFSRSKKIDVAWHQKVATDSRQRRN